MAPSSRLDEPESPRPFQQHPYGGWLPAGSPTRGALTHGFQSVANCLQGNLGVRTFDCCDNRRQAIVGFAASGAAKHFIGQIAVAHICFHGAEQAALGPMAIWGQGAIDNPQDVFPSHIGAQRRTCGTQSCAVSFRRSM